MNTILNTFGGTSCDHSDDGLCLSINIKHMFVNYKMFFLWKWNGLGVDFISSRNWNRVVEFIEKMYTAMK
jgi:hypothetical protein